MTELGKGRSPLDIILHTPIIGITLIFVIVFFFVGASLCLIACRRAQGSSGYTGDTFATRERRLNLAGSTGTALITGAAISLALFLLQLVIALNNDAAAKREKETTSLQSLILALNMGPDLRGLDATGLDDMVYSPKRGKILPGLGTPNTAAARDLCLPQTNKRPPVESKILPQIRLVGKNLDFANFSGLLLKEALRT